MNTEAADPPVGTFPSLGPEVDASDAAHILGVLRACASTSQGPTPRRSAALLLARRAISDIWDEPRLASLTKAERWGRWPRNFPWSPGCHQLHLGNPDKAPPGVVVLEHLVPAKAHLPALFERVDTMTAEELIDYLNCFNVFAVVTKTEDDLISAAGRRSSTPDLTRPWSRYVGVPGLPAPHDFAPLPGLG